MTRNVTPSTVASPTDLALWRGDVKSLAPADRLALIRRLVADANLSMGAAPPVVLVSTREGKLVPYLTKAGADQLALVRGASIVSLDVTDTGTTVDVTARAVDATGRSNMDLGSCEYDPERPATRSRARMVAATRARRRTILGLLGSGFAWSEDGDRQVGLEDVDVEPEGVEP
jgi:hypothetical protein